MADKLNVRVEEIVEKLKKDPSSRFSKSDFQTLVYAVLSDKSFKAEKYLMHNGELIKDECSISDGMRKFLDKVLKHAGFSDSSERANLIDTFEYNPRDIEWITDAVDEALWIYSECGKNTRIFRDKMLQLAVKKMVRSGKYAGKVTYKKILTDRSSKVKK